VGGGAQVQYLKAMLMKDHLSALILWGALLFTTAAGIFSCNGKGDYRYTYTEDFQTFRPDTLPEFWVETYGQSSWVVKDDGGNRFLTQTELRSDTNQVYLHLFERNPVFAGRIRVAEWKRRGHFSMLLRYNADGAYTKVTYFPGRKRLILSEQEDVGRPLRVLDEYTVDLGNDWHDIRVVGDSTAVSFFLDGRSVLSTTTARHLTFGKVGFETYNTKLRIDDVRYEGNEGRPNPGVVQGEIRIPYGADKLNSAGRPFWGLHLGVIPQVDSTLLGIVGFRDHESRDAAEGPPPFAVIRSANQGLSWSGLELGDRSWLRDQQGAYIRGIWPNLTRTDKGWILMGYKSETGYNSAHLSTDEGESWQTAGALRIPDELRQIHTGHPWQLDQMAMPAKLSANAFGLYYPTTRVLWHADAEAREWEPIYVFHPGNTTWNPPSQEHQLVQISDSILALYARDDGAREGWPESQTLVKRWSSDGGRSWTPYERDNTPFVSSKCAFSVKQDPYTGQTWMFWTYNDKDDEPSVNNQPRTRMGLAVSDDSTRTWRYVMDVDDWGYPSLDTVALQAGQPRYLTKDNRFTNLAIWVDSDYLHLTARRRFRHGEESIEDFCIFYTRIEKRKIIPYPEFPGTRY
jgi:hypothetical protein